MNHYAFSIGLIPVQEFISEARRSKDLRAGSAILSWMMYKALKKIAGAGDLKLVVPHEAALQIFDKDNFVEVLENVKYSIPNRASGFFTAASTDVFKTLQNQCLDKEWLALKDIAFKETNHFSYKLDSETINEISSSFATNGTCPLQVVWALRPVSRCDISDPGFAKVGELYTNTKRTRPIPYWHGSPIGKCNQCGKREMFGPHDDYLAWLKWQREDLSKRGWLTTGKLVGKAECLCIICLQKRFLAYRPRKPFSSTSAVSIRYWEHCIKNSGVDELNEKLKEYQELLGKNEFDDRESLFYSRSIEKLTEDQQDLTSTTIAEIKSGHKALTDEIALWSKTLHKEPSNYLAMIMFDGDNMGEKVLANLGSLPMKLFEFSKMAQEQFKSGAAPAFAEFFYIGGDEGLLITPIETAIQTAQDIKTLFLGATDKVTTVSMGIVFFDRQRPLGGAIDQAHETLKFAKELTGKDALAVTVQTASGNVFRARAKWGASWKRINNALVLMQNIDGDILSKSWCYETERFLQSIVHGPWGEPSFVASVRNEVKRITRRKLVIDAPTEEQRLLRFEEIWIKQLNGNEWFSVDETSPGKDSITNQLHVLAFLSREHALQAFEVEEQVKGVVE